MYTEDFRHQFTFTSSITFFTGICKLWALNVLSLNTCILLMVVVVKFINLLIVSTVISLLTYLTDFLLTFKFIIDPAAQESAADTSTSQQSGIDDDTLRHIGNNILKHQLDDLASKLGVLRPALQNYKDTNLRWGDVTNEGTINMLFDWREKVGPSEQRRKLKEALIAARLIRIQDQFLT